MKPEVYAKALFDLVRKGADIDSVIGNLLKVLKRHNAIKLLPRVMSAYKKLIHKEQSHKPTLIVARESDIEPALEEIKSKFKDISDINVIINKNYIGAYKFEQNGTLIDKSFKTKLLTTYRNAIRHS